MIAAMGQVVTHTPQGWAGIQAVYIKTSSSVALPIYAKLPAVPRKLDAGTADDSDSQSDEDSDDDEEAEGADSGDSDESDEMDAEESNSD